LRHHRRRHEANKREKIKESWSTNSHTFFLEKPGRIKRAALSFNITGMIGDMLAFCDDC